MATQLGTLADRVFAAVKAHIDAQLAVTIKSLDQQYAQKIEALESRIKTLEAEKRELRRVA